MRKAAIPKKQYIACSMFFLTSRLKQSQIGDCGLVDSFALSPTQRSTDRNIPHVLFLCLQVRMLADLSLVGCYNMSTVPEKKRAQLLLESAKKNLRDMAFFGLTEYQRKTQFLFERTFRLRFIRPFMQYNSTRAAGVDLDNTTVSVSAVPLCRVSSGSEALNM